MNLEQEMITRYTSNDKIEQGYYLRIRKNKKDTIICVYYNGIEMMVWNKKGLTINTAVFIPNGSNVFGSDGRLKEKYSDRKIPKKVREDMEKMDEYFDFIIGNTSRGKELDGLKLQIDFSSEKSEFTREQLREMVEEKVREVGLLHYFKKSGIILGKDQRKILLFLEKTTFTLTELYDFMLPLLEITLSNPYLKKIDIKVQSKLKKEIDFDVLDTVLERRNEIYTKEDKDRADDYPTSKSATNQEKQKQQEFMVLLNKTKKSDIYYQTKNGKKDIIYTKEVFPFELEYTIYAGNNKSKVPEEKRKDSNIEGRIDNTAMDGNTLHLIEIKYGTSVIAESNGIHKHLIDLYSCLNISKDIILEEFKERIQFRNWKLTGSEKEVHIDSDIMYDIVCIYDKNSNDETLSKEGVKKKIHEIYDKKTTDKVVNCKIAENKKDDREPEKNRNANKYSRELLNKNIGELCDLLKTKGCTVRIILANEEIKNFEEYQNEE